MRTTKRGAIRVAEGAPVPTVEKTLEYACSVAREAGARLVLLHVVQGITESKAPVPYGISQYGRHLEAEARERLHEAASEGASDGPEEEVVTGKPHREILRIAGERKAGLIVMGTHGESAIDRLFFGSTADHVVRGATCPVLTVRPTGR